MQTPETIRARFGLLQWFGYHGQDDDAANVEEFRRLEATVRIFKDLGLLHIRTGISWAECEMPGGQEFYDRIITTLADAGLQILAVLLYTPVNISETGDCAGAPKALDDFAAFAGKQARRYKGKVAEFQLWNEPNNPHYWNQAKDHGWKKFARMSSLAADSVKEEGIGTVMGGTIMGSGWQPDNKGWQPDAKFYAALAEAGGLEHIDAIAFQTFPGMWVSGDPASPEHPEWSWGEPEELWVGWHKKVAPYILLGKGRSVIISETGFSTWDWDAGTPGLYEEQARWMREAAQSPVRTYWYSVWDVPPGQETIGGEAGNDPRNMHFGLIDASGKRKPAYDVLKKLVSEGA